MSNRDKTNSTTLEQAKTHIENPIEALKPVKKKQAEQKALEPLEKPAVTPHRRA